MAFFKTFGSDVAIGESGYDPQKLSSPQVFLLSMVVFLAIVGFIAAILYRQISHAFVTNPGLNGLIIGVLAIGILLAFTQVVRLFREVRWVNSFRAGSDGTDPVLLAPMKALLSRSSTMALSTSSMRSMLDSIANRLDEVARHHPLPHRPAGVPRPARHVLGPARHDQLDRPDDPGARPRFGRRLGRARRVEVGPRRAARRHGHRVLVIAVRPRRLAGRRFPRPAGRPRPDALLHRARELAVDA